MTASLTPVRAVVAALGARTPAALLAHVETVERAPEAVRPRLLGALGVRHPALERLLPAFEGPLCPSFPHAPTEAQAALALGARPEEVLRGLSRREAHEALAAGLTAAEYLTRDLPAEVRRPTSTQVARWLGEAWADPARRAALETRRPFPGPGGAVVEGRLLDRVDELRAADVRRTGSVQEAFRRAATRTWRRWTSAHQTDDRALVGVPRWWAPMRCAALLRSRAALIREGREMRHCVGGYASAVQNRRSVIVALCVRDREGTLHRSTVELSPDGERVLQHRGAGNEAPPELCARALARLMRRIERRER